jgi:hypothetical protein
MRTLYKKGLIAASVSTLLFLGAVPVQMSWDDGISGIPQVHAAGGKGGGHASGGSGGGHGGGSHSSSSHTDDGHVGDDGDSHDHDDSDGGHDSSSGKQGKKGPQYRGGRVGSSKGRGGPGRTVVEKVFETE